MIDSVCTPSFLRIALLVVMATMHFHIEPEQVYFLETFFMHLGGSRNNLAPMKNCPRG